LFGSDTPPGGTLLAAKRQGGAGTVLRICVIGKGGETMKVNGKGN